MKTLTFLLAFITLSLFTFESYSQTYLISQGGTVTTCSGNFYDAGGPLGNYANNQDFTMTFKPQTSGAKIRFVFSSFALESHPSCNKDYFRIFDGENSSAPQLGSDYCGNNSPGTVTATNVTGALTFVFHSNASNVYSGWSASISCTIPANLGLWVGGTSVNWNTASNWYNNFVPLATTNITIPASAVYWPTYTGNMILGTTCSNITTDGASQLTITGNLTISANYSITINVNSSIYVAGSFTRNGTFNPGTGTVIFNGNAACSINGSSSTWTIFNDGFETNTGWTLSGEFQRDEPLGLGGQTGNPDPAIAYSGTYVLGVDLTGLGTYQGDYEKNLASRAYQAISPTINCSGYTSVSLNFRRWLGIKNNDKAYIDVSTNNGSTWTQVWTNTGTITESSWTPQTVSLAAADNQSQVKIRFCLGTTTNQQQYCGWNIDALQVTGTVSNQVGFYNLIVNTANAELVSNANVLVQNNATIKPDAYFTNSSGKVLGINGDALFEANSSGMASYIDNGSTNVIGDISVQQYVTSERWHMVSSPITDATINTYYDIYLKFYNEPTNTWTYLVLPTTIPMNTGQGYSAWASNGYSGTTTVTFQTSTGDLNNSDYYIDTLDYTSGAPLAGFNLLGNPYPCALNWNSSWPMTNLSGWMQIYDNGVYRGYNIDGTSYNGGTPFIPSTQGFWVRALGSGANITIPKSQRVHDSQAFYKNSAGQEFPMISLTSEINGMTDETRLIFSSQATSGFDPSFELAKFENVSEAPTLFTVLEGKDIAVNYLPQEYNDIKIQVGFRTGEEGLYKIASPTISNLPSDVHVYLEDIKEESVVELFENSTYEFAYSPLDDPYRFNLLFKDSRIGKDIPVNEINIYSFKNEVYIQMDGQQKAEVVIYDMMGQEIARNTSTSESQETIEIKSGAGYFLVKVQTGNQLVTKKVFIK
jgi:hypothetical protein